jgi:hypothetical protein
MVAIIEANSGEDGKGPTSSRKRAKSKGMAQCSALADRPAMRDHAANQHSGSRPADRHLAAHKMAMVDFGAIYP